MQQTDSERSDDDVRENWWSNVRSSVLVVVDLYSLTENLNKMIDILF